MINPEPTCYPVGHYAQIECFCFLLFMCLLEYFMIIKLLAGHRLGFLDLGGLPMFVRVCACRDVILLEISCGGSFRNNET